MSSTRCVVTNLLAILFQSSFSLCLSVCIRYEYCFHLYRCDLLAHFQNGVNACITTCV